MRASEQELIDVFTGAAAARRENEIRSDDGALDADAESDDPIPLDTPMLPSLPAEFFLSGLNRLSMRWRTRRKRRANWLR